MKHRICILLAVLLLWPVSLLAATRAWLEQPQVTLGQAVTLNVDGLARRRVINIRLRGSRSL